MSSHGHSQRPFLSHHLIVSTNAVAKTHHATKHLPLQPSSSFRSMRPGHENRMNARERVEIVPRLDPAAQVAELKGELDACLKNVCGEAETGRLKAKLEKIRHAEEIAEPLWHHLNLAYEREFALWCSRLAERNPKVVADIDPLTGQTSRSVISLEDSMLRWTVGSCRQAGAAMGKIGALMSLLPLPDGEKKPHSYSLHLFVGIVERYARFRLAELGGASEEF